MPFDVAISVFRNDVITLPYPFTLGARFNVRIIAIWTTDFALRHPESFALDNDT